MVSFWGRREARFGDPLLFNALLGNSRIVPPIGGSMEDWRFKPAIVLALPSNLALLRKDAGLKCGPYMLLCPLAIRAKKVA